MKRLTILGVFTFLLLGQSLVAEASCGNITGPEDLERGNPVVTVPIADCADPFGVTVDPANPYTILFNGEEVPDGGTASIPLTGETNVDITGDSHQSGYWSYLFKHEGDNYEYVQQEPPMLPDPTIDDMLEYLQVYFTTEEEKNLYTEILLVYEDGGDTEPYFYDPETGDEILDPTTGEAVEYRFWQFYDSFYEQYYAFSPSPLVPGTYTMVFKEYLLLEVYNDSWLNRLRSFFIPTAYAQCVYCVPPNIYTITFTLLPAVVEPTGASSVLFLPGIQASRLYLEENGSENRLWEPNINADVAKLAMTTEGLSINDIYTRDVLDEIHGTSNVYKTFLTMLEELKSDKIIADSLAFAYDWRFGIQDIIVSGTKYENEIKSLIDEVETLSAGSYTDKVTIIAHSNGGLVAKALIRELERLGKADLIDKIVMVGTPQLGTPKAIGVMLHGLDQQSGAGLIIDDETAREVTKNMPGAYTLLPSQKYFDKSGDAVVTSDSSANTASIRAYGDIDSVSKLNNFLLDTNNLRADDVSINEPSTLNPTMMDGLIETRAWLDDWVAPAGVEVYEIIGTGITTIKGFEYRSFPCTSIVAVVCISGQYMKAYPLFSDDGDETVMALSAGGYDNDKFMAKVDLQAEGVGVLNREYEHANLTESPTVQQYLDSIIRFPYLNETLEIPDDYIEASREYTIIGSHSPVTTTIEDAEGNQVGIIDGVIVEDIPGSQYIELGGSTYIIVPKEIDYTAKIKGTGGGVYSITLDTLEGDVQTSEYVYKGASTTPQLEATFTATSTGFSTIETDLNGDGEVDIEQTLDGEIITLTYTYADLTTAVKNLGLTKLLKKLLLIQVQLAERFSLKPNTAKLEIRTLQGIEDTLKLYERKKLITTEERSGIQEIINYLKI